MGRRGGIEGGIPSKPNIPSPAELSRLFKGYTPMTQYELTTLKGVLSAFDRHGIPGYTNISLFRAAEPSVKDYVGVQVGHRDDMYGSSTPDSTRAKLFDVALSSVKERVASRTTVVDETTNLPLSDEVEQIIETVVTVVKKFSSTS